MRSTLARLLVTVLTALSLTAAAQVVYETPRWSQWRGADMSGAAGSADVPLEWGEDHSNVAWKVELPGDGSSTPVAWGQRLFVQSAHDAGDGVIDFRISALDRISGETLWDRSLRMERPESGIQSSNSWASGSAVVDDDRVYAFFGSRGLYALDHDGEPLWEADFGDLRTRNDFGEGTSPGLHDSWLLLNWDQEDDSWLIAVDTETGDERWRVARDEPTTWATPVVAEVEGRDVVVTAGTRATRGYDLESGTVIWEGPGLTLNAIPSPVIIDGIAYLTAGFRGEAMMAIDLARANGRLEEGDAILWRHDHDTPYVPSPVVWNGLIYFIKSNQGILSAVDTATGERVYGPLRLEGLGGGVYASPVVASDRLYVVGRDGTTVVLRTGPEPEVLAVNRLAEPIDASPVIVENDLYLRARQHLYRITRPD